MAGERKFINGVRERERKVKERRTFECFLEVRSGPLFNAAYVGQVKGAVASLIVRGRHSRAFHLIGGCQVLHHVAQPGVLAEHQILGYLRAGQAALLSFRRVRVRVNPFFFSIIDAGQEKER